MHKNSKKDEFLIFSDEEMEGTYRLLDDLSDPKNYMQGLNDASVVLPHNILLFARGHDFKGGDTGRSHSRYVFILSLKGEGTIIVDEKVYHLEAKVGVLIQPFQFHRYAKMDNKERLWLFITFESMAKDQLNELGNRTLALSSFSLTIIRRIIEAYKNNEAGWLMLLTGTFVMEVVKSNCMDKKGKEDSGNNPFHHDDISRVITYIHEHLGQSLIIESIARKVGLSESHLRAKFKKVFGLSLGAYVRQIRLHRASVYLTVSNKNISEVAKLTGYDSLFSFSRAFKSEFSVSPTKFRAMNTIE